MADEWQDFLVEDLAAPVRNAIVGGPFGSDLVSADYASTGVPVIRGENLSDGRWVAGDFVFVPTRKAHQLAANTAGAFDIVFTQRGANHYRQVAMVRADDQQRYVISQSQMKLTVDREKAEPLFVYYVFRTPHQQAYLQRHAIQTGVPHTNLSILKKIPLRVPPLKTQRAIAHILGTLDDKIELNRRMNETLEAMARALFKSWFVDFDPVRAKAEGRDPGLPKPLADLFPDAFEDSELGEIPKGWGIGPLESVVVLQRGFDLPATQRTAGAYPVLAASGPSGTHNEFMVRGPGVTTGRSGVLGKVFYVAEDFWPLNTSLWVKEFRHSRPAYAFHLLRGLDFALFNAGSAVPTLNRNHVHTLPTLLPPMELIDAFERIASASLHRQKHSDQQSKTLAALRDTLLPKLLSGELRLKNMEESIEEVT